ncbi:MAG TPA: hypothetical protein V6D06_14875 [Trichocoleus sp.]
MVTTHDQPTKFEANRQNPCPLCDRDHYCYLISGPRGLIDQVVCQWTEEAPEGWDRTNTAKDGRGVFTRRGAKRGRKHFPAHFELKLAEKTDFPEWAEVDLPLSSISKGAAVLLKPELGGMANYIYEVTAIDRNHRAGHFTYTLVRQDTGLGTTIVKEADLLGVATHDPQTGARERQIEYLYPDPFTQQPLGKVVRRQWDDRRRVYDGGKTKHVRPWHWLTDGQCWSDRGKGEKQWPLYRENEAKEAILKGEPVFVVGGEQAVECYRSLGLTATSCQGGESNYRQVVDRLRDSFEVAKAEKLQPFLAVHPDNDITGEARFGVDLLEYASKLKVPAVCIEPLELWQAMPPGGDIKDWLDSGIERELMLKTLEAAVDNAIDRQEDELRAAKQRDRWEAPDVLEGELGYWRQADERGRYFYPKTDFDFQIERELLSADGGGLLLQVKRADERCQRRVFLKSTDYSAVQQFKTALKKALGVGIICRLSNNELEALIRARLHEYRITRQGKAYRLTDRVGQQEDGSWVFKQCQFDKRGEPTDEARSLWVWNDKLYGDDCSMPSPAIAPHNPNLLPRMVETMQRAFGPDNIYPALLTLGYGAAAVHYQEIIAKEGSFPILNLYGDPGSGKTSAAECALSMMGMTEEGIMRDISLSAAYEKLKLAGSLLHCLDDPKRTPELDEFLKGFYNGKSRIVRGKEQGFNIQRPHSPMMVTTNHACGETSAATQSRLIRLWFNKSSRGEVTAFKELLVLQKTASGCLIDLIKMGYDAEAIYALELELLPHLPYAHARIAKSLALLLHYAQKVAALAGISDEGLRSYVINVLCRSANDPDESGDSLRDFFEKLWVLQSQAKVGDWNMRLVAHRNSEQVKLALYLPGIWTVLDKEYDLAYNRKVIERLLEGVGGVNSKQRFHSSEDLSKAFERGQAAELKWQVRRCIEIPHEAIKKYSDMSMSTESTEDFETAETVTGQEVALLTSECQQDVNSRQLNFGAQDLGPSVDGSITTTEFSVDKKMSTGQTLAAQSLEPSLAGSVDTVDTKNTGHFSGLPPTPPLAVAVGAAEPPPEPGDRVLIDAAASWIRAGSDPLTPRGVPESYRDVEQIPLSALPIWLSNELTDLSQVISLSADGQRAKVRNQKTSRISVFELQFVHVLQKAGGPK